MKGILKRKLMLLVGVGATILILVFVYCTMQPHSSKAQEIDEFSNLLKEHNVTIEGSNLSLTRFQLTGLVKKLTTEDLSVVEKYKQKLLNEEGNIEITLVEMLELHYYSLIPEVQKALILRWSDQKVNIDMKDGAILISYN